jgi:hypothetical protein
MNHTPPVLNATEEALAESLAVLLVAAWKTQVGAADCGAQNEERPSSGSQPSDGPNDHLGEADDRTKHTANN